MRDEYDGIRKVYEERFAHSIDRIRNVDEQFPFIVYAINEYEKKHGGISQIRILDAGCGDGRYMLALEERGYGDVYGFDLFENISDNKLHYKRGSIDNIPFSDQLFDIVYCTSALYYLKDVGKGVSELVRAAKHGGVILCTVTTKYSLYTLNRLLKLRMHNKGTEHLDKYHFRYSIFGYKKFFEMCGCRVILIDGFRMPVCGFIARCIRKGIRVITRNPEFYFKRRVAKCRIFGCIKGIFGYHAVLIVEKQ